MGCRLFGFASAKKLRCFIPGALLVATFALLSVLFVSGNAAAYRGILLHMGIQPFFFPFLDTHGILATAECHRLGIDVITTNPCDVLGRTLDYSAFWLITAGFGIGTDLTMRAGLGLDLVFLCSVFLLPQAKSWSAVAVMTAALLSGAVALALERANLDLAIFVIAIVAAGWSLHGPVLRSVAYGLITLAALIKYYPGIMLLLALRERLRFLLLLAAALLAVGVLVVWVEGHALTRALHNMEKGTRFTTSFGAGIFPEGLVYLIAPGAKRAAHFAEFVAVLIAGGYAYATARLGDIRAAMQSLPQRDRNLMLIGCALIVGCFFTAQNAPYRGIYFLFILPGLMAMGREASSAAARHRLMLLTGAILFLMWDQFFRLVVTQSVVAFGFGITLSNVIFWFLRETVWWWVASILLAILADLIVAVIPSDFLRRDHRAGREPAIGIEDAA